MSDRNAILKEITEISFTADDLTLYLETVSALTPTTKPIAIPNTPDRNISHGMTGLCPGTSKEVLSDVDL